MLTSGNDVADNVPVVVNQIVEEQVSASIEARTTLTKTSKDTKEEEYSIEFSGVKVEGLDKLNGADVESIGTLTASHYCSCRRCNGKWTGQPTALGTRLVPGRTVAVDAKNPIVPLGTKLLINGHVYTVEDTGNLNRYGRQLDILVDSHSETQRLGVKQYKVYKVL